MNHYIKNDKSTFKDSIDPSIYHIHYKQTPKLKKLTNKLKIKKIHDNHLNYQNY